MHLTEISGASVNCFCVDVYRSTDEDKCKKAIFIFSVTATLTAVFKIVPPVIVPSSKLAYWYLRYYS